MLYYLDHGIGAPQKRGAGKWGCLISRAGSRVWGPSADSPEEAIDAAKLGIEKAAGRIITLGEAIAKYLDHQRHVGLRPNSVAATEVGLMRFFAKDLNRPLSALTPAHAASLYGELRHATTAQGTPLAVASHRTYLASARGLLVFCVEQHWLRQNPMIDVKPVGRVRRGKLQLRMDEARILVSKCIERAQLGDDGAMAVLLGLLLGLRADEIATRAVRDIDDDGRVLWVAELADGWRPKTACGRRAVGIPEPLRPLLVARCQNKSPEAWLFSRHNGSRYSRDWTRSATRRLCKLAGVPLVCAHALRGQHATIAIQEGVSPHIVAAALGQESPRVTLNAYAAPGSQQLALRNKASDLFLN